MSGARSAALREHARRVMPGGVSSPVRAFAAVGGQPPVIASAQGGHVTDEDGRDYIDITLAFGPHILGHGHPVVVAALRDQLARGTAYGATTAVEIELAERIRDAMPALEMVRFVNSGTEATMSALRLARAITGRDLVIKCAGAYHGHADAFLAAAGSGVATLGLPGSPGVPAAAVAATLVVPYNDAAAVAAVLDGEGERVAALIVEPVAGNMGCVPPQPGYLGALRTLTRRHGCLLIFDEVMTGFRVGRGGAQERYGVVPDLTTLGKVIGGGLPVGAFGGAAALMERLAPVGDVYQAGTLSGNPLAMAAGCAALQALGEPGVYQGLEVLGGQLERGLRKAAAAAGVPCAVNRVASMITPFVGVAEVSDFDSASRADTTRFASVHRHWLERGVLWPPSQFEAGFLCAAHTEADVEQVVVAFAEGLDVASGAASSDRGSPA